MTSQVEGERGNKSLGPSTTSVPNNLLDPVPRSPGRRRALLQIAVGRSPPLGYRRLDDAPPAREGQREIKLQIAVGRSPPLGYRRLDDAPPAREGQREIKRSE
eukprot:COSAG06_NODE_49085_length_327_cov_4.833333_1_plen_102_part_01